MKNSYSITDLERFIVVAKSKTYVGGAQKLLPYRLASKDIQFADHEWSYHDSYFGDQDFIGQEVVYFHAEPVWAMNYYGYILDTELISSQEAGKMIMNSLTKLYAEGRFLGGFETSEDELRYDDSNEGDIRHFKGKERIFRNHIQVYELVYHGGLIK
ncbi:DUF5680 domain-containing protein [Paenibacillus haidiansis]